MRCMRSTSKSDFKSMYHELGKLQSFRIPAAESYNNVKLHDAHQAPFARGARLEAMLYCKCQQPACLVKKRVVCALDVQLSAYPTA